MGAYQVLLNYRLTLFSMLKSLFKNIYIKVIVSTLPFSLFAEEFHKLNIILRVSRRYDKYSNAAIADY